MRDTVTEYAPSHVNTPKILKPDNYRLYPQRLGTRIRVGNGQGTDQYEKVCGYYCRRAGHACRECRVRLKFCFIYGSRSHFLRECTNYRRVRDKRYSYRPATKTARCCLAPESVDRVAVNLAVALNNEEVDSPWRVTEGSQVLVARGK